MNTYIAIPEEEYNEFLVWKVFGRASGKYKAVVSERLDKIAIDFGIPPGWICWLMERIDEEE